MRTPLRRIAALFLLLFFTLSTVSAPFFAHAQSQQQVSNRRAQLQSQLDRLEDEIAEQQKILEVKQHESVSLERDIAILDAQIQKARLSIEHRDLTIRRLTGEIGVRVDTIGELGDKLTREKASLAQLLRRTNELDNVTLVEVVLSNKDLSEFFEDLDEFAVLKGALQESFREIETTKDTTETEKTQLEDRRSEEFQLRELQVLEKQKIERDEAEKEELLAASRGVEARYLAIIEAKQQTAAQIRAELFGLRGSAAIPFGRALELANIASAKTGVRPALILGVIEQETKLGENIGNCNLPDDPPQYKWSSIMKSPRDTVPYLDIVKRLGLDPGSMPLSCPPGYGFGGAMGPAQFIPSTWVLYEDRIAAATGHNPPNPWNPEDAFMASALLLSDNGADQQTPAAERLAALRYFAGWKNAERLEYSFYGDGVMRLAQKNQQQIDILAQL